MNMLHFANTILCNLSSAICDLLGSFVPVIPKPAQAAASCGNIELFRNLGTLSLGRCDYEIKGYILVVT